VYYNTKVVVVKFVQKKEQREAREHKKRGSEKQENAKKGAARSKRTAAEGVSATVIAAECLGLSPVGVVQTLKYLGKNRAI
jgi:hypothetical protein